MQANNAVKILQALYRRQCIDIAGLHNPVEQWCATCGRLHPRPRWRIASSAEVLPRWHNKGIETAVRKPVDRDAFRFGLYTSTRRAEVCGLEWARVELLITRQLAAILKRRLAERDAFPGRSRAWVFPSENSRAGHIDGMQHLNAQSKNRAGRGSCSMRSETASSPWPTAS